MTMHYYDWIIFGLGWSLIPICLGLKFWLDRKRTVTHIDIGRLHQNGAVTRSEVRTILGLDPTKADNRL